MADGNSKKSSAGNKGRNGYAFSDADRHPGEFTNKIQDAKYCNCWVCVCDFERCNCIHTRCNKADVIEYTGTASPGIEGYTKSFREIVQDTTLS